MTPAFALNGILIAIVAHGLIGISLVWDKVLLQRRGTQNLVSYVFWLGAISVFGLVLIPFGCRWPGIRVASLAFAAGTLDLVASFFYYWALKAGEASDEVAAIGGFAPVATALIGIPLLRKPLGGQLLGFSILTAGGFVMFFADKRSLRKMLPKILIASAAFGMTNVLQKTVFNQTNFVSGYVFFTIGTFLSATALLVPPSWRRQIVRNSGSDEPRSKTQYFINRFIAGVGSFLVVFAVSRANPALVESISGLRYVIVFLGAYAITRWRPAWFREDFRPWILATKALATSLVIAGLVLVGMQGGGVGASGPQ
ncbi:MAG TPA: EamA family transporter [Bryobacteraceae bacterium]|nr:EamA family transporter [Bryobacteraceae bacterium]